MWKWPDDFINQIICGDSLEVMKEMPDKCVDLVLTDPPYGISYKNTRSEIKYERIENDSGEIDYVKLITELERVAKIVIIFGAENFYKSLPHKGRWICWDKRAENISNEMPGSPFELAWINKTHGYYRIYRVIHGGAVNNDDSGNPRFHPTQKPIKLFGKIMQDFTKEGEIIFDSFLGSGTTAVAAKQLGRKFIGIEISPKYCKIAEDRLRQEMLF